LVAKNLRRIAIWQSSGIDQIVQERKGAENLILTAQVLNQVIAHLLLGETSVTSYKADLTRKETDSYSLVIKEIKLPAE
jgi:hypothetical protein